MSDTHQFFYIDRPNIPATQQSLIDPCSLLDSGVVVDVDEICTDIYFYASEIKDESGAVHGTILYAPDQTYANVVGQPAYEAFALGKEDDAEEDDVEEDDSVEE